MCGCFLLEKCGFSLKLCCFETFTPKKGRFLNCFSQNGVLYKDRVIALFAKIGAFRLKNEKMETKRTPYESVKCEMSNDKFESAK